MVITHRLKMNMEEGDITQRLEMPMGDVSTRQIEMLLYLRQSPWTIPQGVTVLIHYMKPDGTKGEYDTMPDGSAAWSVEDNVLTISVAPQALTAAGNVTLYAQMYLEEKVLQTFAVEISVKAPFGSRIGGGNATTQDYYYATNVLRGPVMAQVGQILTVENVDASGRVTKVEAMDAATLVNEKGNAVLYAKQNLTEKQQSQARANIGAASTETVFYKEQTLTDAQKETARANIGAASALKLDWVAGKFYDNALVLPDEKLGNGHLYSDEGKLKLTFQDGQEKTVTFLTNEDEQLLGGAQSGVLYTEQSLTDAQKGQARDNIGAAGANSVSNIEARLLEGSLALTDQKNNDDQLLYAEAGKLCMKNRSAQNMTVTFLTSDDEQRIVDSIIAALPIYNGEVEPV